MQRSFSLGCRAKIRLLHTANLTIVKLVLKESNLEHKEIYRHYPLAKPGQWLTDSLINAGQAFLKDKFPAVHGLQENSLSLFQPQNDHKFVQILNCEDLHWVCISTINCKSQMVKVNDSMRTGDVPSSTN